ncbi:MAG TPA: LysE family transporter [Streptosporangiaceae bacterium]|nr:LysE family transporter [Streptosporangiaceae bacterium]
MAAGSVIAFWSVALLLIMVPGADWAFTIGAGLRGRSAVPAVSGIVAGYAAVTVVVAAGVGALVARTPPLLTGLSIAGGLYLMGHGARTFARPAAPGIPADAPAGTFRATLLRGMGVSALNPKGLLLFLAFLPQFTSPRWSWPMAAQLAFLGLVFTLTCAVFYLSLGSAAQKILRARPAAARAVTRFSGAAMVVIGALILAERLLG